MELLKRLLDTQDYTTSFNQEEIDRGKFSALIGYFWILFFIPLLNKNNRYAKYHANQGLVLFIFSILSGIFITLLSMGFNALNLNIISIVLKVALSLLIVFIFLVGVINVLTNKAKDLPLIGSIRFIN